MPPATLSKKEWRVLVKGEAYGPYALDELRAFIAQGRVKEHTQVSCDGEPWRSAAGVAALTGAFVDRIAVARPVAAVATPSPSAAPVEANMIIAATISTGAFAAFERALVQHGRAAMIGPSIWILRTRHTLTQVRSTLAQTLTNLDRFVVVDATRDRVAWHNMGLEIDAKVKTIWNAPLAAND